MAFLRKNLVPVFVFEEQERESGYVGTEIADVYVRTVNAIVQPANSSITAETYGERISNMLTVYCPVLAEIDENCKLSFSNGEAPTHKIVSVKRYQNQKVILAEAVI